MPSGNILVTDKKAFYLFESKIDLPGKVFVLCFSFSCFSWNPKVLWVKFIITNAFLCSSTYYVHHVDDK